MVAKHETHQGATQLSNTSFRIGNRHRKIHLLHVEQANVLDSKSTAHKTMRIVPDGHLEGKKGTVWCKTTPQHHHRDRPCHFNAITGNRDRNWEELGSAHGILEAKWIHCAWKLQS